MEIDWREYYLAKYQPDVTKLINLLHANENDLGESFITETSHFISRYLSYRDENRKVNIYPQDDKAIIRVGLEVFDLLISSGSWSNLSNDWGKLSSIADELNDPELIAMVLTRLALTKNNLGEVTEAQLLYENILNSPTFNQLSAKIKADAYFQAGVCYLRQGKYINAKNVLNSALVITESFGMLEVKAYVLSQLGNIAVVDGEYDEALKQYDQSLETFIKMGQENNLACVAYQSLGRFYLFQGRYDEAIPILQRGLEIRRKRKEKEGIANNAIYLASAYVGIGMLSDARLLLNEALELCKKTGDPRGEALCRLSYGKLLKKENKIPDAIYQWNLGMAILETTALPSLETEILVELLMMSIQRLQIINVVMYTVKLLKSLRDQKIGLKSILRNGSNLLFNKMGSKRG